MSTLLNSIEGILDYTVLTQDDTTKVDGHPNELILERLEKINCYKIHYNSNGKKVVGYVLMPKQGDNHPCIIFNRGGSKDYGKLTTDYVISFLGWYASQGYIVIASQYSGNDGGEGKDELGGDDLDDVLNLKNILDQMPIADTNNIFMLGASRGGIMTYLAMCQVDWIKASAVMAGTSNVIRSYQLRPELKEFRRDMYDVDSESENMKRSAIYLVNKMCKSTPLLLLHGNADDKVSVLDSLDLALELQKHGHPFAMEIFKDGDHNLTQYKREKNSAVLKWFKMHYSI